MRVKRNKPLVEIHHHAKIGHSGKKNKEGMNIFRNFRGVGGGVVNRVKRKFKRGG